MKATIFIKSVSAVQLPLFLFAPCAPPKILRTHSSASVIAKLARFLKVLLPEEKQISFFTYSLFYPIFQWILYLSVWGVFLFSLFFFSARPIFLCLIFLLFLYFHNGNWGGCLFLLWMVLYVNVLITNV